MISISDIAKETGCPQPYELYAIIIDIGGFSIDTLCPWFQCPNLKML